MKIIYQARIRIAYVDVLRVGFRKMCQNLFLQNRLWRSNLKNGSCQNDTCYTEFCPLHYGFKFKKIHID